MGAEISMNTNKMVDVKTRKNCTEDKYLDLRNIDEGIPGIPLLYKNNNSVANRYYKTQFREICSKGYYDKYRGYEYAVFRGNIIPAVAEHV